MAADLELRRQAIAEALRAVMAEPVPASAAQPNPIHADPRPAVAREPVRSAALTAAAAPVLPTTPQPEPLRVNGAEPEVEAEAELTESAAGPPPLREALTAQIDWDEVEELDSLDEDWEAPSVPPLETAGSMSRTASMALFGHA